MKRVCVIFLAMTLVGVIFIAGAPEVVRAATISYTYDDAGRLTRADYGADKSIVYTYDSNGNLLQRAIQEGESGSLQVTIEPEGARAAGAQWRRTGTTTWFDSGATETGLAPGDYTVEFKAVTGWTAPANQNVTVTANQTTQTTGTYTQGGQTGSLQVTIEPEGARAAGAQWRRTGTTPWFNSWATETGLTPGAYTVEFKAVNGWTQPADQNVTVTANETIQTTGTYTQGPAAYTLTTTVNPAAGGTVAKNPDKPNYDPGENVQVTATASANHTFEAWSGDLTGTANPATVTMDGNKTVTANFVSTQTLATGKASSFKATVTRIEMFNGNQWVEIFSGAAQLDMVTGGVFPGVANLVLPQGTYSKIRITFKNSFSTTGTLSYSGTPYYTTAATFRGQTNLASVPTTVSGSMAAYIFRMAGWGALDANAVQQSNITPITVSLETNYQPILRFTLSNTFHLMGIAGDPSTYYFSHSTPGVSVVE